MIYFDNAATSGKKPKTVVDAVSFSLSNLSANPGRSGHDTSVRTADAVYSVRQKLADFFGSETAENVIFTLNCTHSINCVLKGVIRKGEHIVVSDLEHNSVMRPIIKMRSPYTQFRVGETTENTLKNLKDSIKPNTKLVFVTAASNVTGQILPLTEIGEICKKKGILFGVDAAQGGGVIPINMQKMNIDYLCVAPHKGLYAPMGVGVLICRKPIEYTILEGGTGTDSIDFLQPNIMPEGFESGTVGVPAIMGVGAGVDFVKKIGIENIYKHEFELMRLMYERLCRVEECILYTSPPKFGFTTAVLPLNLRDVNCFNTAEFLNSRGIAVRSGLHCAPTAHKHINTLKNGTVRVSFGVFNTLKEVEFFCNLLSNKNLLKKYKKVVD